MILPFKPLCSLKNLCSNGRDTSGVKQNLNALSVAPDQGKIKHTILHGFDPLLSSSGKTILICRILTWSVVMVDSRFLSSA